MEIEQRIGRIDRIGQKEETILVVNFVNDSTIDERILTRLLDRIDIFESSIGALEPIISANAPKVLQAGFDFTLTEAQRNRRSAKPLPRSRSSASACKSSPTLLARSLSATTSMSPAGRRPHQNGPIHRQRELALLLDDWARVDGAPGRGSRMTA